MLNCLEEPMVLNNQTEHPLQLNTLEDMELLQNTKFSTGIIIT